jgi:ABC-type transport system involved in multi-copper enzyme maturation permease subunit
MTWVVWRMYRTPVIAAAAALAAFAVLLLITDVQIATGYHSALRTCAATRTCGDLASTLNIGSNPATLLVGLSVAVPALLGLFWGAPVVAREIEAGTSQFVWVQSVTRVRWLAVKTGWLVLAAAIWGGAVSALVTWWSGPQNAVSLDRFNSNVFDVQGIVPVGYALFAVALGIAVGTIVRRTLPALAITLGVFVALRIVIARFIRPHYMHALTLTQRIGATLVPKGAYWQLSSGVANAAGAIAPRTGSGFIGLGNVGLPVSAVPAACQRFIGNGPPQSMTSCLNANGLHQYLTYQPASHYWPFQLIETGIFLALAAALIAVTFAILRRRDA